MASVYANIKPGGLTQKDLVDLMYMLVKSFEGICAKLDDDAGVPMTDYEANCITALLNMKITNSKNEAWLNAATESSTLERITISSVAGLSNDAIIAYLYQMFNMIETLTEQLDADVLTDSNYEALCYTALLTWIVENTKGNSLGNGTAYYFRPGGETDEKQLIDCFYQLVNCLETLTEKLDADGTVTDTNYEALWFTATILLRIKDTNGNALGVARTLNR